MTSEARQSLRLEIVEGGGNINAIPPSSSTTQLREPSLCSKSHLFTAPVNKWEYLCSEPFKIRHLIAAYYLKDCPRIIEIGGYHTPIVHFLAHCYEHVLSVDPLIEPRQEEKILHAKEDYRFFDFKPFIQAPYALVILGMDLPFDFKLFHLAASAKKVIIEYPPQHLPSQIQFEMLQRSLHLKVDLKVGIDLSENDFGDLKNSYPAVPKRLLFVLSSPS